MVALTQEHREQLQRKVKLLEVLSAGIEADCTTYDFPNRYTELTELITRQQTAVTNLLQGRELGCSPESLKMDDTWVHKPHLDNLAFVAKQAQGTGDTQAQACFLEHRQIVLHNLKGSANVVGSLYYKLNKMLNEQPATDIAVEGTRQPGLQR